MGENRETSAMRVHKRAHKWKMLVAFQPWEETCGGVKLDSQGFNLKKFVKPHPHLWEKHVAKDAIYLQEGKNRWGWGKGSCHTAEVAPVQMGSEGKSKRQFQKDAHDLKYYNLVIPPSHNFKYKKFQGHTSQGKVNEIYINRIKNIIYTEI